MIYDNGIFVNDQIGISATFSLVALGVLFLAWYYRFWRYLLFRGLHILRSRKDCGDWRLRSV